MALTAAMVEAMDGAVIVVIAMVTAVATLATPKIVNFVSNRTHKICYHTPQELRNTLSQHNHVN